MYSVMNQINTFWMHIVELIYWIIWVTLEDVFVHMWVMSRMMHSLSVIWMHVFCAGQKFYSQGTCDTWTDRHTNISYTYRSFYSWNTFHGSWLRPYIKYITECIVHRTPHLIWRLNLLLSLILPAIRSLCNPLYNCQWFNIQSFNELKFCKHSILDCLVNYFIFMQSVKIIYQQYILFMEMLHNSISTF